eukprot:13568385-Alexandrium_andersonii.AAC.1
MCQGNKKGEQMLLGSRTAARPQLSTPAPRVAFEERLPMSRSGCRCLDELLAGNMARPTIMHQG